MTASEILKNFEEDLAMEDQSEGQDIDLNKVILDILKYLDYKERGVKNCSHGELNMLGGKVDYAGINYRAGVCPECGKILLFLDDGSGRAYETFPDKVNGIDFFKIVLIRGITINTGDGA